MVLLKTDPTVLKFALCAGHMVTAIKFVTRDAAFGAKLAVIRLLPVEEFLVDHATFISRMGHFATFKAYVCTAITLHNLLPSASLLHVIQAARPWAPHKIRVEVNVYVQFEL